MYDRASSFSKRTESRVGMMSWANLGFSSDLGYVQVGTWCFQCCQDRSALARETTSVWLQSLVLHACHMGIAASSA
jgi:hypothetical protein